MYIRREKKNNNNGAAMMLTIIIIAVLIVFTFSLILISYNLYASQNKNLSSDRNSEAANSLSRSLREELTDGDAVTNSNLWKYLRWNIAYMADDTDCKDWPYYAPNKAGHGDTEAKRYFKLDRNTDMAGMPADVSVCIYWELPDGQVGSNGLPEYDKDASRDGIILHIVITCKTGGQVYTTADTYRLTVLDVEDTTLATAIAHSKTKSSNPADHTINSNEDWQWKYQNQD
ncbi:MAG TPA: hypothetical protein DEO87_04065 [Lachnospiraceae bacterium]|nr:hypothetical protein [Lachnospiraceae bacterium]